MKRQHCFHFSDTQWNQNGNMVAWLLLGRLIWLFLLQYRTICGFFFDDLTFRNIFATPYVYFNIFSVFEHTTFNLFINGDSTIPVQVFLLPTSKAEIKGFFIIIIYSLVIFADFGAWWNIIIVFWFTSKSCFKKIEI